MKKLRSDTLKVIAMILMAVDHAGILIVQKYSLYMMTVDYNAYLKVNYVYEICRAIGRLAFPIFAYQIAIGITHTKNRARYLVTLGVFALVSEIPYDICFYDTWLEFSNQNVIFTMFLGALAIYVSDILKDKFELCNDGKRSISYWIVLVGTVIICCVFSEILNTDYNSKGVILIVIFYLLWDNKVKLGVLAPLLFVADIFFVSLIIYKNLSMTMTYCNNEIYAVLAFPLIALDTYERKGGKLLKWCGYAFYPLHILILYGIGLMIG